MRVGLTGGIGSGKSEVARVMAQCGALVIDADLLAREAVVPGSLALAQVARLWPDTVNASGVLDRAVLGAIVFADPRQLQALNAIVHPAVRLLGEAQEKTASPDQLIVHVVPLLFEEGFAARCDVTVVVWAPEAERIARVQQRDGLGLAEIRARMARQIDPERACVLADRVVENTGDVAQLRKLATLLYEDLRHSSLGGPV